MPSWSACSLLKRVYGWERVSREQDDRRSLYFALGNGAVPDPSLEVDPSLVRDQQCRCRPLDHWAIGRHLCLIGELIVSQDTSQVVLEHVSKAFQQIDAVSDVSLSVERGQFLVMLGPSGSGKTTLLRLIAGFERPSSGVVRIGGFDTDGVPPSRRDVGVVHQQLALFPHLTVQKNIAFGLEVRKLPREDVERRVAQGIAMVRLDGLAARMPHELSGGQQQRVALARALVIKPSVLLLDEPLGSLDKNLRAEMQAEIRRLQQELGITTVMVTHDQEEAMTMGDRIAILHDGRLEQEGTPSEIYGRPLNRFVAGFMGEANLWPIVRTTPDGEGVRVEIAPDFVLVTEAISGADITNPRYVMVRPEDVRLSGHRVEEPNCFLAHVTAVVFGGATARVRVRLLQGVQLSCLLPARQFADVAKALEDSRDVYVHWTAHDCRVLYD